MRLKRRYQQPLTDPPVVIGVTVQEAGREQNFTPRLIDGGIAEGWLTMEPGRIVIRGDNLTVKYRVVLPPGYYCCYCDRALDDGPAARTHIYEMHEDLPSPDPNNPAGYRRDAFFACVLES